MASANEGDSAAAAELLEDVVEKYPDVIYHCADPRHPEHRVAAEAEELLYRINYLSVGRPAMEISGVGLDDAEFKLSDYRGKVVILDFWADWCPPCQEMWPHEKKLVEDLRDEPFALVGVFRGNRPALKQLVDNEKVNWKNWVDDTNGPISTRWRVTAVPMIYVLDHNGVIRHQAMGFVPDTQLSRWVHDLLAKVPKPEPHTVP